MGKLSDIVTEKQREIARLRAAPLPSRKGARSAIDPYEALRRPEGGRLRLIAEIKRRSPSAGALSTALSAVARGLAYERAGAVAVSVLTDGPFFDGSFGDLRDVSGAVSVPTLCKDFVLDEIQLAHAEAAGASLVLLIVRLLDRPALAHLVDRARAHGLAPLVEITNEDELALALSVGARVIGVNARDLDTLVMDGQRAARVIAAVPRGRIAVHLSGIKTSDDVRKIAGGRADAALTGEALMRADDPLPLLTSLVEAT